MTKSEILAIAKPILFNTDMVRAILDGRKTQTRRVIKGVYPDEEFVEINKDLDIVAIDKNGDEYPKATKGTYATFESEYREYPTFKSNYEKGDILYVRETWAEVSRIPPKANELCATRLIAYRADGENKFVKKWRPSIHMPKEAARIFLRVTGVRVERVQDITVDDILAEGIDNGASNPKMGKRYANMQKMAYEKIWDSTIPKKDLDKYGYEANPWVWVIAFERIDVNG